MDYGILLLLFLLTFLNMNKKILAPTAMAVSVLAVTLLSGCANISQQIAQKMTEGVVNQATGGKVKLSDQNGNMTITDNEGNVAQVGGGDQRPASVPSDIPSLPGAKSYGWFGSNKGGLFSFTLENADYKTACDQMVALVKAQGWAENSNGFNMEMEGSKTTMYQKPGYAMTLTCAGDASSKEVSISLTKSVDDSATTSTGSTQANN